MLTLSDSSVVLSTVWVVYNSSLLSSLEFIASILDISSYIQFCHIEGDLYITLITFHESYDLLKRFPVPETSNITPRVTFDVVYVTKYLMDLYEKYNRE